MSLTQSELALRIGVSQPVVANALNGKGRVSDELRQRILMEAERLGYRPNRAAKTLATGRSHSVQLWIASLQCPYSMRVCAQMQELANAEGYDLAIIAGQTPLVSWPTEGLFLLNPTGQTSQLRDAMAQKIPTVGIGCFREALGTEIDSVFVDLRPGTEAALRFLIESGCRRIAFVGLRHPSRLPENGFAGDEPRWEPRFATYKRLLAEAGLPIECILGVERFPLRRESRAIVEKYVRENGAPNALFCNCDDIAIGASWALQSLGLKVPDDVKIIGCDGIDESADIVPALSTIEMPIEEMCQHAWRLFLSRRDALDAKQFLPAQSLTLPAPLVLRASAQ